MTTSVLHIYPKNDSLIANYVNMLAGAMGQSVSSMSADNLQEAKHYLKEHQPDIVHQHGLVEWAAQLKMGHSRRILTPHGQTVDGRNAYVVVARSDIEAGMLGDNPRVETLRNPLITKTIRPEEAAERMSRIYQKVMDSDVLPFLSDDSRHALSLLLKVALCGDPRWVGDEKLPADVQWRQLYIYTSHEGVSALLDRGLNLMGLQIPPHTTPVSYLPEGYQRPVSRTKAGITELVKEMKRQMQGGRLELMLLCDLHQALRRPSLNEERLLRELEDEKLTGLFASALQLLKEQMLLDEGFMPCPPVDNRTTAQLRTSLTNHMKI